MILKYIDDLITCDPWIVSCEYLRDVEQYRWDGSVSFLGYKITTSKNEYIGLYISSDTMCCEDFGAELYFRGIVVECNSIVGSIVKDIKFDYDSLNTEEYQSTNIIIETNRGTIKLLIYNEHNGYYSHEYIARIYGRQERGDL
jgi:hypothetical protein